MIAFWTTVEEELFDVTKYDEILCKKIVINKQTCHDHLASDIDYVLGHFQENAKLVHHTKSLRRKLQKIRRDETNKMFWSDLAPRMMKINYEQPVAEAELMVAGIKKAAKLIDSTTSKRQIESAIETRSKKQQKVKASQIIEQVEYDGLYVGENDISVGTTIKRKALQLFHESKSRKLSARERKVMTQV